MKSKRPFYYKASEKTGARANALRKDETSAEHLLWRILRGRKLNGLKFRRQHPIAHYIVDFYCHDIKLIIELDGDVHSVDFVAKRDALRQRYLEEKGLTILRYQNELVFSKPEVILNQVLSYVPNAKKAQ